VSEERGLEHNTVPRLEHKNQEKVLHDPFFASHNLSLVVDALLPSNVIIEPHVE